MSLIKGEHNQRFLCCDSATEKLYEIDEDGNIAWELHTGLCMFDIWGLPDGNILFCHYGKESGVRIIDRQGNILHSYKSANEIFSCQPLENGNILVGELRQKRLVEVNLNGQIVKEIPVFYDKDELHEVMRGARKLKDGTYMVVSPGLRKIIFYNDKGEAVRSIDTRPDTFGAVVLPNGNILYSGIEGLAEVDRDGKEVWTLLHDDVPEVNICWLLGIQLKENGNVVCCNWLGHDHDGQGVPIFEVNRNKEIVWQCDTRVETPNLSNFHIITDLPYENVAFTPCK